MFSLTPAEFACRTRVIEYKTFRTRKRCGFKIVDDATQAVAEELGISTSELLTNTSARSDWASLSKSLIPPIEKKNHAYFSKIGREHASIWTTPVMLRKSIIDATADIRFVLEEASIHDYKSQEQGPDNKVIKDAFLVGDELIESKTSLYRPMTKSGDPRIWFTKMSKFCSPGDELVLACENQTCFIFNFSKYDYEALASKLISFPQLNWLNMGISIEAQNLLEQLQTLSGTAIRNPVREAGKKCDTDVGMAVEAILGVAANSRKAPDLNGIELKAWRAGLKNRHALFTQVPDWHVSHCHSFQEFVSIVGYPSRKPAVIAALGDGANELRCTVSAIKANAQGLKLFVDKSEDLVVETTDQLKTTKLLVWPGDLLRNCLKRKHPETFWIECRTVQDGNGGEVYYIERVHYTRSPLVSRFLSLVENGFITLDHMIGYKPKKKNGEITGYSLSEKGPSWKIHDSDFDQLFPAPQTFEIES